MLKEFEIFGIDKNVEFKAGVEAVYLPKTSEMITKYISKIFQQKILGLIDSKIEERNGWYKFKVKKIQQVKDKELEEFIKFALWELGNVPTHHIEDVEKLVETGSDHIKKVFNPIIKKAKIVDSFLKNTFVYIDLQIENFGEDKDKNIIGFDAIHICKSCNKEDEIIMREYIFS